MRSIVLIAHNIRSTHNVGSLLRTCEGLGVGQVYLTGYTPYPIHDDDKRLPHIAEKLTKDIHKTALGAETLVPWAHLDEPPIRRLRSEGYRIIGLEQDQRSISLEEYAPGERIALILGEEVEGINQEILEQCDDIVEIPMVGQKESFNVSVAAGIALYALSR